MPKDAMALLKDDHKKMKKMLNDLESTTERGVKTRQRLIAKMKEELKLHEAIEEEIFYPAMREHEKAKEIVAEAYAEHHAVDMMMDELEKIPFNDEGWAAQFTVIKENIEHHIEEEEGELFTKAHQIFDAQELKQLGAQMMARKEQAKTPERVITLDQQEEARR